MTPTHDRHPCAQYIAELATLRQWDARKPEVQAKVVDEFFVQLRSDHSLTLGDLRMIGRMVNLLRTGKRPPLKLEE